MTPAAPGAVPKPVTAAQARGDLQDDACTDPTTCTDPAAGAGNPVQIDVFTTIQPGEPADPGEPGQTVTIADVARFLPATAVLHAEPAGWAVVGVPANFWAEAAVATVDGELLGETAQVRFTPRGYRFEYGDGAARSTPTPGASWQALGVQELTATATSHVYTARATRRAVVSVYYSAEYRFAAGPWTGIDGAVIGQAPPVRELVVVERTALTATTSG